MKLEFNRVGVEIEEELDSAPVRGFFGLVAAKEDAFAFECGCDAVGE